VRVINGDSLEIEGEAFRRHWFISRAKFWKSFRSPKNHPRHFILGHPRVPSV